MGGRRGSAGRGQGSLARTFYDSTIWNFVEKTSIYAAGLLLSVLLARSLGPTDYGLYASLMSVAGLVPLLISLGFERAVMVEVSRLSVQSGAGRRLAFLLRRLLLRRGGLAVLAGAAIWVGAPPLARLLGQPQAIDAVRLIGLYTTLASLAQLLRAAFIGLLRIRVNALVRVVTECTTLLLVFAVLRNGWGIPGILSVFALSNAGAVAALIALARRELAPSPEPFDLKSFYRIGRVAWIFGVLGLFLGKDADIFLMNLFRVPSEHIGFYNIGVNLYLLVGFLGVGSGPIAQAIFGRVVVGRPGALDVAWRAIVKYVGLLTVPVFVFVCWHVHPILTALYGESYRGAAVYFWIYASFLTGYAMMGASYCDSIFYAVGRERLVLGFRVASGLSNLVLDCLFIPLWGAAGAAVATGIAYAGSGIGQVLVAHRLVGGRPPVVFQAKLMGISVVALLPIVWLPPAAGIVGLVVRAALYGLGLLFLLILIKPIEAAEVQMARNVNAWVGRLAMLLGRPQAVAAGRSREGFTESVVTCAP